MKNCNLFIPGEPQGKGRPRFSKRGNFVNVYTPKNTETYEDKIRWFYNHKYDKMIFEENEPLTMYIVANFGPPKSTSRKKRLQMIDGEIKPTKKPDIDNIAKIIMDALNGFAYKDDKQIIRVCVGKFYAVQAGVEISIRNY